MELTLVPNLITLVVGSFLLSTSLMLVGIWITIKKSASGDPKRWLDYTLAITIGLVLLQSIILILDYFAIISFGLLALFLAPIISCVLVIIFRQWREWEAVGTTARKSRIVLLILLMAFLGINWVGEPGFMPAVLVLSALITLIWNFGIASKDRILGVSGLIVANWYFLDVLGILNIFLREPPGWLQIAFGLLNTFATILIILIPGILIFVSLQGNLSSEKSSNWFRFAAALAILGIAAYGIARNARWASVNAIPIEDIYPFLHLLVATMTGMLLTISLHKDRRFFGPAFTILVSFLVIIVFNQSWKDAIEEFNRQASLFLYP